jgi:NDP-sugar pyrophosphorylase family protein
MILRPEELFDLSDFPYVEVFDKCEFVWEALMRLDKYLENHLSLLESMLSQPLDLPPGAVVEGSVYIGKGTRIEPGAYICGPAVIGENCEIRQGAYIRGHVILGKRCVIGHVTEMKNSILLNDVQAPHFSYIGDSIVGNRVDLGAGTILANMPITGVQNKNGLPTTIHFPVHEKTIDTGLVKLGAMLGDDVNTGCNVVTNPGCVVGPRTAIYPLVSLKKGYYPADCIVKLTQSIDTVTVESSPSD